MARYITHIVHLLFPSLSDDFCCLAITIAGRLGLDQDRSGSKPFDTLIVFRKKNNLKKVNELLPRPNKKISVVRVTGLKILGRVGTFFLDILFFMKQI